jgi:subtilisin family serine protease
MTGISVSWATHKILLKHELFDADRCVRLVTCGKSQAIWPVSYIPAPLAFTSSWGEDQKTGYHPEWNVENLARAGTKRAFEDVMLERRKNNKHSTKSSSMPSSTSAATPAPSAVLNNTAQPQAMVPNGYGFLPMSGVDRVHAEGNTGQGVKIAIVDSGVFYTNPALGGCFGPGCLVAGGRDYVGDEFDGVNGLAPDNDPLDCTGHGTFVSGIVGAQLPNRYNVSGVAPGASIYAYRVFSCYSATTNDIVAKAMEDAFTDGNDIINLSLGETSSWSGSMLSVIGARIAARGVSVMASAGNGGYAGTFYTESPGTGVDVLSVGAVDNVNFPGQNATLSFRQQPLQYIGLDNIEAGTFPLVSFTNGAASNNDGCPVPADLAGIDFTTTVLVYQQSNATGCDIYTQGYALADAGVQRALLIASPGAEILPPRFGFQLGVISYADGQEILRQIAQGNRPFGTFAFAPNAVANPTTGGLVSLGSALGPTNDMYMKPQLVAPGNNIVSTAPTASGFGASGGTSYSCSYVAGVAALYLSANGGRTSSGISAREITRALEITSNPLPVSNTDSRLNTLAIAGSGLIQAYDAIHTPIKVSKSELLLNDTANFADYQTFDVVNTGNDRLKFTLSHTPAQTAYSFKQVGVETESRFAMIAADLFDLTGLIRERTRPRPPCRQCRPGQVRPSRPQSQTRSEQDGRGQVRPPPRIGRATTSHLLWFRSGSGWKRPVPSPGTLPRRGG